MNEKQSALEKVLTIKQNYSGTRRNIPDEWVAEGVYTPTVGEVRRATAELAALRAQVRAAEQETEEFNAGYQAYQDGLDLDTAEVVYRHELPDGVPSHDVFGCGYAWAKFQAEQIAALQKAGADDAAGRTIDKLK